MIRHANKFPNFVKLTLDSKCEIESFVSKFPPYSDFNFFSLYNYNTNDQVLFCYLNNNLVIMFVDYITSDKFLTFLGRDNVERTIHTLLEYSISNGLSDSLKLIPYSSICDINNNICSGYVVSEDIDNNDYVYSISDIVEIKGNKYKSHRHSINKFKNTYGCCHVDTVDLTCKSVQTAIIDLYYKWMETTKQTERDYSNEFKAIQRLIGASKFLPTVNVGFFVDHKLAGITITEIIDDQYAMGHFGKADNSFVGIYKYMEHMTAKHYLKNKCKYLNNQQDLGISGLRHTKKSWNPLCYCKKYKISYSPE